MITIDGVQVFTDLADLTADEAARYVAYVRANAKFSDDDILDTVYVKASDDGFVDVSYSAHGVPFHRLRRITGYLTSDLRSWNDSKRAEEKDRVKHVGERHAVL